MKFIFPPYPSCVHVLCQCLCCLVLEQKESVSFIWDLNFHVMFVHVVLICADVYNDRYMSALVAIIAFLGPCIFCYQYTKNILFFPHMMCLCADFTKIVISQPIYLKLNPTVTHPLTQLYTHIKLKPSYHCHYHYRYHHHHCHRHYCHHDLGTESQLYLKFNI